MTLATSHTSAPRPNTSRSTQLRKLLVGHDLVEERMDGQARRHCVDPNAMGSRLDRAAPGQRHHPGLGRGVVGLSAPVPASPSTEALLTMTPPSPRA